MHIEVNGTRLWFDVDRPSLVPDDPRMRQRPAVVLVHGGPGSYDHSYMALGDLNTSDAVSNLGAAPLPYQKCSAAIGILGRRRVMRKRSRDASVPPGRVPGVSVT
jgi:hypothetical protein